MNPSLNAVKAPSQSKLAEHYAATRSKDEHVTIEWDNIEYSVVTKDSKKSTFMKSATKNNRILKNVSGRAESGQLLAIMGPTGKKHSNQFSVSIIKPYLWITISLLCYRSRFPALITLL